MRSQFVETTLRFLRENDDAVLLLGDIGVYGFRQAFDEYPSRVYNIGILEQATISVAAGLSLCGMVPIVHTIAPFIVERGLEQIKVDLCYQNVSCKLVSVGASYDYAALGCTHHSPADVPTLNQVPKIEIIVPGHKTEFDALFSQTLDNGNVSYYRLSEEENTKPRDVKFGKNEIITQRGSTIIIAVGTMLERVLEAIHDLDVSLVYCTTVKPFDTSFFDNFDTVKKIIIVEPYYSGAVAQNIFDELEFCDFSIEMIGVKREFIEKYGTRNEIDQFLGLDVPNIRARVINALERQPKSCSGPSV